MQASNNNYKLIFFMAAVVSVVSTLAFVTLVPSHAREKGPSETSGQGQQTAASVGQVGKRCSELYVLLLLLLLLLLLVEPDDHHNC